MMKIDEHLAASIDWAEERLRNGAEPPFIYYRLMQLREAAMELKDHAKRLAEGPQELAEHQDIAQQIADEDYRPNIVPLRPGARR